jgi:hypothetical protein
MADGKFRRHPQPDPAVVDLLQRTLQSARDGRISAVVVVVADRLQHVETATAGELSEVRITNLLGGLTRATRKLLKLLDVITPI